MVESGPRQERIQLLEAMKDFEAEQKKIAEKNLENQLWNSPEGVLMDPPFWNQLRHEDATRVPNFTHPWWYNEKADFITFDDGTIYYPDGDKYIKRGEPVEGPSEGARPVDKKTMEAAEGGRVPFDGGGSAFISDDPEIREFYNEALKDYEKFKDIMSFDKFMSIRMRSFAGGGRVPLAGGKGVLKGLAELMEQFFPGTTKLGKTSKPMAEKTQLRKAIADFKEREKAAKNIATEEDYALARDRLDNPDADYYPVKGTETKSELEAMIKKAEADEIAEKKYWKKIFDAEDAAKKEAAANKKSPWYTDPKTLTPEEELRREFPEITDDLIKDILADTNPQRIAEVKATMHEALKMREKGMGVEEIINIFKKKPTKHASGGRVSLSAGGLAGMLGE
jgi:hypothetical protein